MTTITPRVPSGATADNTIRVFTTGETPSSVGTDTWGGTFGGTWRRTWYFGAVAVAASPAPDNTNRVGSAPTGGITKRVSGI
jgi:hypothetical protein